MNQTVKISLEGDPHLVELISNRISRLFTVTYISKDRPRQNSADISRYLRVLPPGLAHTQTQTNPPSGGIQGGT